MLTPSHEAEKKNGEQLLAEQTERANELFEELNAEWQVKTLEELTDEVGFNEYISQHFSDLPLSAQHKAAIKTLWIKIQNRDARLESINTVIKRTDARLNPWRTEA